jgi:hypothetical protein
LYPSDRTYQAQQEQLFLLPVKHIPLEMRT